MSKIQLRKGDLLLTSGYYRSQEYKLIDFDEGTLAAIYGRVASDALKYNLSIGSFHNLTKHLDNDVDFVEIDSAPFGLRKFYPSSHDIA